MTEIASAWKEIKNANAANAIGDDRLQKQARGQVASALDNMKKNGMQVTELSAAEVGKLRDKMRPVIAKFGVSVGQDTVKELQAELEKARK